jgi:hypothetical protein
VGDVNGDGKLDLVVANTFDSTVSVLLNTTAPAAVTLSFAAHQDFGTGAEPRSVTVGDMNGDGKLDLAVANNSGNTLSVLLNTTAPGVATPSFAAHQDFGTGAAPRSVTVGDVNGDGKLDLAVANYSGDTVSVLLNTTAPGAATPSFAAKQDFATGFNPRSVKMGDLNGDGKLDLVVANNGSATVSVLLNTTAPGAATPSFAAKQDFGTGSKPISVTVGDLNGDGKLDLVVANSFESSVSVLLNTTAPGAATPSFAAKQNFGTGGNPYSVTVGDLNGDGHLDLVVANLGDNTVSMLLNTTAPGAATPSFAAKQDFGTGGGPYSVTASDLNGDGHLDLAVANNFDDTVSVLLNTTAAGAVTFSFAAKQDFGTGSTPFSVTVGDVNGDGKLDLAVANANSATVSVLLNTTAPGAVTPSFAAKQDFATGTAPFFVTVGDVNGDGKPDLIVANFGDDTVSVLLNTPKIVAATGLSRQQGSAASNSQIATVTDYGGNGSVIVTVSSANPSNGVTISNIVSTNGNITADIVASCTATNATFTLQATDGSSTVTDTLNVMVTANTAPTLSYSTPQSVGFNGSLNLTPTAATDNGSIIGYAVQSVVPALTTTPTVNASGVVSITNAQPAGSHTITIRATDNCGATKDASFMLNVSKANQTISVGTHAPANATYNSNFTVASTSDSGLAVAYSRSGVCTNVGAAFTMTSGTGTCTVRYDQTGDSNYNAATQVTESVNAQKANQTITFAPLTNKTFGDADFTVSPTATSGLAVSFAPSGQCTMTGNTVHLTGASSCTITATQAGDANYNAATDVPQSFSIAKSSQTITFGALPNKTFGDPDFMVNATASSSLAVSFSGSGNCLVTGNTVHLSGAGSCTITAKQTGDANFNTANDVPQSFSIGKSTQTITFAALANKAFGDADFTVGATSSSGLSVSFAASGNCTVTGSTIHLTGGGACTITAKQAGDANFNAANDVPQNFTIGKSNQTITFGALTNRTFGNSDFTVSATASSGLAVSFDASGQCAIAGTTVHLTGAGSCTITAKQAGDSNFDAAPDVPQSFTIGNGALIMLSQSNYNVNESTGFVTVTVNRTGDLSVPVTVDYATDDTGAPASCGTPGNGLASSHCDFGVALGTLKFAATETQKTFMIPITQDSYTEGPEIFKVNLSNVTGTGAALATPSTATVTISDSTAPAPNANDDTDAFVRQHYRDFLNREADPAGLAFWTNQINSCGNDAACRDLRRINTSAAFFLSIEFQQTGNLVRSLYVAALNRPLTNNMLAFLEFERDTQAVQNGVTVGQGSWQQLLNANRNAFMKDFVTRAEFAGLYPATDTPAQYVDELYMHAGVIPTSSERGSAIAEFGSATTAADAGARGRALLDVTQNTTFQQREMNRSFVQMEYFGYLRRNPNDVPDGNFAGYDFWLSKLNTVGGNFINAEMVKAFITSSEYRRRFGS